VSLVRSIALTLVLSVLAGGLGAWIGARYTLARASHPPQLHQLVHHELDLSVDQERRIEGFERDYAARRRVLEAEMKAANAQLAQAYQEGHGYTPQVQAAIDRFHKAMAALQKETIAHVFAMRSVLTTDQAKRFDETVVTSLTASPS
jgi:hypothetical protein